MKNDIPPPSRVSAAVHSTVIQDRNDAVEARDSAEELLSKAEAKMSALRKTKDAAAVRDIDAKFDESNWEERFDDELSAIRDLYIEVGGREIVRLLILDHLGKEVRPDFQYHPDEAQRAVELDVYDDEGKNGIMDTQRWLNLRGASRKSRKSLLSFQKRPLTLSREG